MMLLFDFSRFCDSGRRMFNIDFDTLFAHTDQNQRSETDIRTETPKKRACQFTFSYKIFILGVLNGLLFQSWKCKTKLLDYRFGILCNLISMEQ